MNFGNFFPIWRNKSAQKLLSLLTKGCRLSVLDCNFLRVRNFSTTKNVLDFVLTSRYLSYCKKINSEWVQKSHLAIILLSCSLKTVMCTLCRKFHICKDKSFVFHELFKQLIKLIFTTFYYPIIGLKYWRTTSHLYLHSKQSNNNKYNCLI